MGRLFFAVLVFAFGFANAQESGSELMKRYAYTFNSPGKSAADSMPIGNGDIAANVYTQGDSLYLLLSKNDAYDGVGDSLKTGRVKIAFSKNPFAGADFKQRLDIDDGCVRISAGGVKIKIWADANNPVYTVEIKSESELGVSVERQSWERRLSQDVSANTENAIVWYHKNAESAFAENMNLYRIAHEIIDLEKVPDPLLHHAFVGRVEADGLKLDGGELKGSGKNFEIRIGVVSGYAKNSAEMDGLLKRCAEAVSKGSDFPAHKKWWADFWDRSYICATSTDIPENLRCKQTAHKKFGHRNEPDTGYIVSQHYNVQRYMMACQSRGPRQVKFNGGLFTFPMKYRGKDFSEDTRNWGRRHTFQNQRLLYWPMLQAGDYDLMRPFFDHYARLLPIRRAITKMWFGIDGAYFRENCEIAGDEIGDGGAFKFRRNAEGLYEMDTAAGKVERAHLMPPVAANGSQQARPQEYINGDMLPTRVQIGDYKWMGYHNTHFNSGLELCYMAIKYYRHTGDEKFFKETMLPFCRQVLLFYALHFPRESDGKLNIEPSQALETYWYTKNNMPDVAGLRAVLDELLDMGGVPSEYLSDWRQLRAILPELPKRVAENGREVLAFGEKVMTVSLNSENPELYAAFPYDIFGVAKGNEAILKDTVAARKFKGGFCWNQDEIFFAHAGMAADAKNLLIRRFSQYGEGGTAFPMFARGYNDYIPDFDNNGSGSVALQRMLIQENGDKIVLLPAWPKDWDCEFKLRAAKNTVLIGSVKGGKLADFRVWPASRRKDVSVREPM